MSTIKQFVQKLATITVLLCSPVSANDAPKLSDVYGFAAYLLSLDKPDEAAYVLETLIKTNANARLRFSLANTYYRAGRIEEADKLITELMVEAWRYPELVTSLRKLKAR